MAFKKWIACLLLLASATPLAIGSPLSNDKPEAKIPNGWLMDAKLTPYHVLILEITYSSMKGKEVTDKCGANIIDKQRLLTATHWELETVYFGYTGHQ